MAYGRGERRVVGLWDRLRKLELAAVEEIITIPQADGTVARFPVGAGEEAFMNLMLRLGAGEDAPLEHPMIEAIRNSSDPRWYGSFYVCNDPDEWVQPVEDLSE
jgi:hypothetical protein